MTTRRQFLSCAGAASAGFVTLLMIPIGCTDSPSYSPTSTGGTSCNGVASTSSVVESHSHTLCVPVADLSSPPAAGVSYRSSVVAGHTHSVALTQGDLSRISSGGAVTVTSSTGENAEPAHSFTIARATGTPAPTSVPY